MQNFLLGEFIRQRRLDLGLTQEEVCDGICEPITLSRIENGKQTPSRSRINAILQRLDLPDDRYYALLSKDELEIEALEKEIVACNATRQQEECLKKLTQLEKLSRPDDHLTQQFILRSKALLGKLIRQYTSEEQLQLLMQAIQLTIPSFSLDEIERHLYTKDEIKIINQIANVYSDSGNNKKAADIFYQLLKYVRKHYQETITSTGILPLVLYNYARVLDLCGRYEEGAQLALEGKDACIKYGHFQLLSSCIEIYAECNHFLGNDAESAKAYRQAYYLCEAIGHQKNLDITKQEAKEYLGLTFND